MSEHNETVLEIVVLAIDDACVGADAEGLERAAERVLDHLDEEGWGVYRKDLVEKADAAWTLQQVRSGQWITEADRERDTYGGRDREER